MTMVKHNDQRCQLGDPLLLRSGCIFDARNPAKQLSEVGSLSHYLQGFPKSQVVGNGISEPSTVCLMI